MTRGEKGVRRDTVRYRVAPSWRVSQDGRELRVYGGGDAEYLVELDDDTPSVFAQADVTFRRRDVSPNDLPVFEQLLTAGVLEVIGQERARIKVCVVGDRLPFAIGETGRVELTDDMEKADIVVVVRYVSTHEAMARQYYDSTIPYVYVDMAYHHTVSIGPLVYPGETACIGCLYGRIASRWGDAVPPASPEVGQNEQLIQALLATELERIAAGDTSLVGKVVAWDIAGRSATVDTLLKSSACPQCGQVSSNKAIAL